MELGDPGYCDVIVHRWERHTGGEAVRGGKQARTSGWQRAGSDRARRKERDAVELNVVELSLAQIADQIG